MDKKEMIEKLLRVDEDVFFQVGMLGKKKAKVVIVGGSALLLSDLSAKPTTKDIDVFQVEAERAIREIMYADQDINSMCQAFALNIPYNYEDRLQPIDLETFAIDFYVPSQEDLAVMKLYRWEDPDIADLTAAPFLESLDWDLLEYLVFDHEEAAASRIALPENDSGLKQMRFNYEQYKRGWKK